MDCEEKACLSKLHSCVSRIYSGENGGSFQHKDILKIFRQRAQQVWTFRKKKLTWLMNLHSTWPDKRYRSLFWVETTTLLWIFLDQERKNTGLDRIFLVEVLKLHSTPRMDLRRKKWFSKYLISQFISDFRRKFFQSVSGHFFRSAVKNAIYASRGSFWETNTFWKKIPFVCFPEMSEKN